MQVILEKFISMDLEIRAMVLLGFVIIIFWWLLGKKIAWTASVVPYLLKKFFECIYVLIEIPICLLHKKIGTAFVGVDNGMALLGQKVDFFLETWYCSWHYCKKKRILCSLVIYGILIGWICLPHFIETNNTKLLYGQKKYLEIENGIITYLKKDNKIESVLTASDLISIGSITNKLNIIKDEKQFRNILLVVATEKTPLSIRDVPSIQNYKILDKVSKGSIVIWKGELAFGTGSNDKIEAWVKVETDNGIAGWTRLKYLYPKNKSDFELDFLIN